MILMPKEGKAYALLPNNDVVKQYDRIGIKGILIKQIHCKSAARKIVIIANDGILIKGVGFQSIKGNGILSDEKILFGDDAEAIVKNRFKSPLRKSKKGVGVPYAGVKGKRIGSDINRRDVCRNLVLGFDTCHHGLVAVNDNVLNLGAVDIFDRINGIFNDARSITDVILQHDRFHIRAFLKHIARILFAIESEGHDLKAIGIVDMYIDVYILIRRSIVNRIRRANDVQRGLDFFLDGFVFGVVGIGVFLVNGIVPIGRVTFIIRTLTIACCIEKRF